MHQRRIIKILSEPQEGKKKKQGGKQKKKNKQQKVNFRLKYIKSYINVNEKIHQFKHISL